MQTYTVVLRNAAGREIVKTVTARSAGVASNRAVAAMRRVDLERWYVVSADVRGREIA
jgi:hypothetical protein